MNWMNFAWIAGVLLGSLIVGLIVGRVVAGIKYPNPDKPHIFTPKQSAILLVAVLAAIALVIFSIVYQPKPKNDSDSMAGMDGMMGPDGMVDYPGGDLPVDGLKEGDPEPVDVLPGGEGEQLPDESGEDSSAEDGETSQPEDGADLPEDDTVQPAEKENPVT